MTARVRLIGKLDIQGAEAIALPLATPFGRKQNLLIDLSGVSSPRSASATWSLPPRQCPAVVDD